LLVFLCPGNLAARIILLKNSYKAFPVRGNLQFITTVFAAQWDGVYRKEKAGENWQASGKVLPGNFAGTTIVSFNRTLVINCTEKN
jgi:hypothetical protein